MNCPKCGAPNREGAKFCKNCGTKLPSIDSPAQSADDKGLIDNLTHLGTFIQRGSTGVQREIRNEERARVQRQAESLGLEVSRPRRGNQSGSAAPEQPRERRLSVSQHTFGAPTAETINVVSGRAIWNINKGEVARRITESEFASVEGLKGVIIQEGCTAIVYIDGQLVSMMQSGCYTFPAKTQTEIRLEQRQKEIDAEKDELKKQQRLLAEQQRKEAEEKSRTFASRGVFGEVAAFGRGVMNFLFGKKKDEKPEVHKERIERTEKKLRALPAPKICRVYIVSNRIINLLFGSVDKDGVKDFAPMLIPSKLVDLEVAVSMQLQVTNITQFAANYLADRNSMSVNDLYNELATGVKTTLTNLLRNLDYEAMGLPEPVVNNLKLRLQDSCNERLQGIEVIRVVDITDQSADFARFREVERELFTSEKELGFLQRTNEFRNRLEQEQNKPIINQARNAEDLRQALQAINKDKLLSEDEMEQFVLLLESQKRLREARSKEEEYEALIDLKKCRLVKDDDLAALENSLAQGVISRENVTDLMRIQAAQKVNLAQQIAEFELSDNKREHDMANALRKARHDGEITAVEIDTRRLVDAYNDERNEFDWKQSERVRQAENEQAVFEQNLAEQKVQAEYLRQQNARQQAHQNEMDRMAQLIAARDRALAMQHETDIARINAEQFMTQEQIAAAHMQVEKLDANAQAEVAKMMGSGNKVKAEMLEQSKAEQQQMYEKWMAQQDAKGKDNQQTMLEMARMMQQGMLGAVGAQMASQQQRYDDQVARTQEYQQQAQMAQDRQMHATDQALGSMGNFAGAAASNIGAFNGGLNGYAPQPAAQKVFCPSCGAEVPAGSSFCVECGEKID